MKFAIDPTNKKDTAEKYVKISYLSDFAIITGQIPETKIGIFKTTTILLLLPNGAFT